MWRPDIYTRVSECINNVIIGKIWGDFYWEVFFGFCSLINISLFYCLCFLISSLRVDLPSITCYYIFTIIPKKSSVWNRNSWIISSAEKWYRKNKKRKSRMNNKTAERLFLIINWTQLAQFRHYFTLALLAHFLIFGIPSGQVRSAWKWYRWIGRTGHQPLYIL